ncbi:MAG: hypothetical protein HQL05_03710 [Nitrospirae bacterium]|uniref:hypothetical protein n=1 Tax=Candidatus Magnetobacterium casense TaxID=1455061 RepID=UPI0005905FBF|nr:hypothetical protein [Candidatus Magnetobacterium casensis]MBF0336915.1 hypothetical protein [Nitrospirota bacterium]
MDIKNVIIGFGSVIDIFPSSSLNIQPLAQLDSDDDNDIAMAWADTGNAIRYAMGIVDAETKQVEKT